MKLYLLLLTLCSNGQDGSFLVKAKLVHLLFRLILGHYFRDSFEITWDIPHVNRAGLRGAHCPHSSTRTRGSYL